MRLSGTFIRRSSGGTSGRWWQGCGAPTCAFDRARCGRSRSREARWLTQAGEDGACRQALACDVAQPSDEQLPVRHPGQLQGEPVAREPASTLGEVGDVRLVDLLV